MELRNWLQLFFMVSSCFHVVILSPIDSCPNQDDTRVLTISYLEQISMIPTLNASALSDIKINVCNLSEDLKEECCRRHLHKIQTLFTGALDDAESPEEEVLEVLLADPDISDKILSICEEKLELSHKIVLYKAMSKLTVKGNYTTVKRLFRDLMDVMKNETADNIGEVDVIKLRNQSLYTIAMQSVVHNIEGSRRPEFWFDLLNGPYRILGYSVVRDIFVYIGEKIENDIPLNEFAVDLIDIITSITEVAGSNDIKEPITGLFCHVLHIVRQTKTYELLDTETKTSLDAVYDGLNNFEKALFASGEFCINMQLFDEYAEVERRSIPAVFIRNVGTSQTPEYNWFLWTNHIDGPLIRLSDNKVGVIASYGNYHDINTTIYRKLDAYKGDFLELRKDVCTDNFNAFMKYLCLPLYEMMGVFKETEEQTFDYVDRYIGLRSENCVRINFFKKEVVDVDNDI